MLAVPTDHHNSMSFFLKDVMRCTVIYNRNQQWLQTHVRKGVGFDHNPRKIQDPRFRNGYVWPLMGHARHSLGLSFWRFLSRLALLLKKVSFMFCFGGHSVATDRET